MKIRMVWYHPKTDQLAIITADKGRHYVDMSNLENFELSLRDMFFLEDNWVLIGDLD